MLERTQVMMGTFVTISLPKTNTKELQESFELLKEVESSLSSYDKHATIYSLNHQRKVKLTPYSFKALSLSQSYYKKSAGYFDITVGSITKDLYHFGEDEVLVENTRLQKAKVDFNGVHFTQEKAWLDEGITVDLGGMGKGFGVDVVATYLREQNISVGVIALSGDIRCLDLCAMCIQDPFREAGTLLHFKTRLPNTAISTSGNYRRFIKDTKTNHLINPKKRASQQGFASVTLVSLGSNADIDAYATAASVMPLTKAIAFLDTLNMGYLLVTVDGTQYKSQNLAEFIRY